MLLYGQGVETNLTKAIKWFVKAAENGDRKDYLNKLFISGVIELKHICLFVASFLKKLEVSTITELDNNSFIGLKDYIEDLYGKEAPDLKDFLITNLNIIYEKNKDMQQKITSSRVNNNSEKINQI